MENPPSLADLRIAVCGHRYLSEPARVARSVDRALDSIALGYPGRTWIVLSALAEGADQLVVERILLYRPSARLHVPLPMPEEAYLQTFSSPTGRENYRRLRLLAEQTVTLPAAATAEQAFAQLGGYLTAQAGLLIAVWDGRPARGPGGTGEIVGMARRAGLPMVWVDRAGRRKVRFEGGLVDDHTAIGGNH
jgi:hypothetical protein